MRVTYSAIFLNPKQAATLYAVSNLQDRIDPMDVLVMAGEVAKIVDPNTDALGWGCPLGFIERRVSGGYFVTTTVEDNVRRIHEITDNIA